MPPLRVPHRPVSPRGSPTRWRIPGLAGVVLTAGLIGVPVRGVAQADTGVVRPAPLITLGDLRGAAIGTGLAALAVPFDAEVRRALQQPSWQRIGPIDDLTTAGNRWGHPSALMVSTGMWVGGRLTGHPRVAQVGFRAFEAIGVSGVITRVMKGAIGRARPGHPPEREWDAKFGRGWEEGDGSGAYEAMPSGHATAAFAFASAVSTEVARIAPTYARPVWITTYGLATWTAYSRMHTDAHWLSDVLLGATVGTVTGWAVTRWHATRPENVIDRLFLGQTTVSPIVAPTLQGGTHLGVSILWR